ncbi:CoA transferase [Frankia nepalensis]|uniref:CoA transferase n=1 Tax=Frankia nepalensis TaxID=1836974 RepID=UPI0038991B74
MRVVESPPLEPASLGALLAELGVDIVKVDPPSAGDYTRCVERPLVDGVSIFHRHRERGKSRLGLGPAHVGGERVRSSGRPPGTSGARRCCRRDL